MKIFFMLENVIAQWDKNKVELETYFKSHKQSDYCNDYADIVKAVFTHVIVDEEYDLDKMTVVDNGDYQGSQIF